MERNRQKGFILGGGLLAAFILWTILIQRVDVQPAGVNGTSVGFAAVNTWFHHLTGVHMAIYTITDWLGAGAHRRLYRLRDSRRFAVDPPKKHRKGG